MYSIIGGGTAVPSDQFALFQESVAKTECDFIGGKILLVLGVLHEPLSPSESTSSGEINTQETV